MGSMHQILILPQFQKLHLIGLSLLLLLQSLLRLHSTNPSDLLIRLNPCLLEPLDRLLQLPSDAGVLPGKFDDPAETVFGLDTQLAELVVELVEFWVVGDVQLWDFDLIIFALVVDRDQPTVLALFLHFLKDFNEKLQLFLQFFSGASYQRREFLSGLLFGEEALSGVDASGSSWLFLGKNIDLPECNFIMNPLGYSLRINFLLLLIENGHYFFLGIGQVLVLLVGGIEVQLAHLMCLEWDLQEVDDLNQFVHAEQVLRDFSLVQGYEEEVQQVLLLIFR